MQNQRMTWATACGAALLLAVMVAAVSPSTIKAQQNQGSEVTFSKNIARMGIRPISTNIGHMRSAGKNSNQLALMEGWRDDGEIKEMARAAPRIIGHINIARLHRVGIAVQRVIDRGFVPGGQRDDDVAPRE